MSTEAISVNLLVRELTRELHNRNVAIFAGAGLSMASGYVDWKILLKDIIKDLGLDPSKEDDLVTMAQYHCNQSGGNRAQLTQTIFDHFSESKTPTANHRILAHLPILTYWTTNYDKLIETSLIEAKKVPDVKYTVEQLASTRLDRDVSVYKMHGDIEHASKAIITKDDYESYPLKMVPFLSALRGDLIEKTFLFLGFSFTDPNIDYILSRVRVQYEVHQRQHYRILRKASKFTDEIEETFKYRELKQHYFIRDLKRFGIQTVLVNEYIDITDILQRITSSYKRKSIFISGAAYKYGNMSTNDAQLLLHELSNCIVSNKNRIVTGFGLGVGSAVINGAITYLNSVGKTISDEYIVMRPFPQIATGETTILEQRIAYRKSMIEKAGIAIFVFGNKCDPQGNIVMSDGMRQEFDLCATEGVRLLPIGATGYMAEILWREVMDSFANYYPDADSEFRNKFEMLGDSSLRPEKLIKLIQNMISHMQRS